MVTVVLPALRVYPENTNIKLVKIVVPIVDPSCTRNERVETVATVVVVGVKYPRLLRVKQERWRGVGVILRRVVGHGRIFLPGVI